ncbi:MAG: phosphorylase [Acidobacteria bacterium]|nr:phosphorylase [Acidobacteriota bacterium]
MAKLSFSKSDFFKNIFNQNENYDPIRGELYSVERLEQFAAILANEHKSVDFPKRFQKLHPRLEDNREVLIAAYYSLANAIREERAVSQAAEWLVDNFHIVEEQLREIQEDLPAGFYRELPKLSEGEFAGFPRIYAVAMSIIAHTDSRLEVDTLARFLRAYQAVTPLTIGELWAVAITLRFALVENLRRLAQLIVVAREEREEADDLADELLELANTRPNEVLPLLKKRLGKRTTFGSAYVEQFTRQLRDQDLLIAAGYKWLSDRLNKQGTSIHEIVDAEYQRQATTQVTIGNAITSMRLLSTIDWNTFFENVSLIDPLLQTDPAEVYSDMNFATRDRYRKVIERIAKRTKTDELTVADKVVELAAAALPTHAQDLRESHIGYFLIDKGVAILEKEFAYRYKFSEKLVSLILKFPAFAYLGSAAFLTVLTVTLLVSVAWHFGAGLPLIVFFALMSLIPASEMALSILNWDFTLLIPPRTLPQMETSKAIPADAQTFVVIPTLLTNESSVAGMLEKLEVYSLANNNDNIYFALLSDFGDAATEEMMEDAAILESANAGIADLNRKYRQTNGQKFHLFHRRRLWNESEQKWMGWERKRGKLEEFNGLLRGSQNTSFTIVTAEEELLRKTKFVITLDSDTQLPRDSARKLIGIASHPLNRAFFDEGLQRVTKGFGILQPRVSISLTSASRSYFARIFSGNTGIDPYTTASSDIYQDLFGEGSFTGKGLYDVDVFSAALRNRVPENCVLSHDLFEGLYARCGLVTDIELLDDFPTHFDTYSKRSHRWVRGDWQIAAWLMPWVKNGEGKNMRNELPVISRWKILDNLRRSLVAPAIFLWLLTIWTLMPGPALWWTSFIVFVLAFPVYAHLQTNIMTHPRGIPWTSHFWSVLGDVKTNTQQVLIVFAVLAYQAYSNSDAVIRTLYRVLISQKNLLEWKTAAQSEVDTKHDPASYLRSMGVAIILSIVSFILVLWFHPSVLLIAAPFLLLWMVSPLIAYRVSLRPPNIRRPLNDEQIKLARMIARRTWRFFETFVGDESHWLPPDNFQEDPQPKIAHRTSPTNIGLLLLSTISAHDFGYIGTLELTERLGLTFATLGKLEKVRGHYLNWYNTETLAPLAPRYISSVDSGNLAGHLLAVKQAVMEILNRNLLDTHVMEGLADSLQMMREEANQMGVVNRRTEGVSIKQLHSEIDASLRLLKNQPVETPDAWVKLLESLISHIEVIGDITRALTLEHGSKHFNELGFWSSDLSHQAQTFLRDIKTFIPWQEKDFSKLSQIIDRDFPSIQQEWRELTDLLNLFPSLSQLPELYEGILLRLSRITLEIESSKVGGTGFDAADNALKILMSKVKKAEQSALGTLANLNSYASQSSEIVKEMNFDFLLDEERKVFVIGYNVDKEKRDNSFYDLLASESRLASFVAIAKDEVEQEHWFRLGRSLTPVDSSRALVSWTGTMFEYLMPLLVMHDYEETLLSQTYKAVVQRQIEYGAKNSVPWGISECAFNARDLQLNYQYQAFGVPGLGLKRGLSEDLVVAPYATALAAAISPNEAMNNLRHLATNGMLARFGFYESIDYTTERLPHDQTFAIVKAYMAHHQGMILVALNNLVHANVIQERFHSEPLVKATELLLQERIPHGAPASHPRAEEVLSGRVVRQLSGRVTRVFNTPNTITPRVQLLSNGIYSVMVTTSGAGYSTHKDIAVTRWREDTTRDLWGSFVYLRNVESGDVWSGGYQPLGRKPEFYEVAFSEDKAVIKRSDGHTDTRTEIIVSPEDNAEIRRVAVTNNSSKAIEIEVTSYAEIVLAPPKADAAHPAFSNLSIETEFNSDENSLIAKRRPRAETDEPIWAIHTIATDAETVGAVQYETDRARFLGRGHDTRGPRAVIENRPLSNTVGSVLDPIFSLRCCMRIEPRETACVTFSTAVAASHDEALRLADKYHDVSIFDREATLAWTRSQVEMRHLNIEPESAYLFQRLAAHILYTDVTLRSRPGVLKLNTKAQSDLWPYGIGGDLPVVLVRINRAEDLPLARQMLNAHEYLRLKGLIFDLVILNDNAQSYMQTLQDELTRIVRTSGEANLLDKTGGIFLRRTDQIPEADRILLHVVARVVIVGERGGLEDELLRKTVETSLPRPFVAKSPNRHYPEPATPQPELSFFNGLGGFGQEGKEYVTVLGDGQWTPAPWLNVIANNSEFGFQVSETGSGFTWSVNSRENRLTPWSNDAVSDPPGEVIYLRDEESGSVWTPTALPIRESEPYTIKHGQGYTIFEHPRHGISQELVQFVPLDATVKISLLRLHNRTGRRRKLSITSYSELVLGFDRSQTAPFIITVIDDTNSFIRARNPYNNEFAGRVAFVATSAKLTSFTCDRKEFVGRNGSLEDPAALKREKLSGRIGAGLDPCAALQTMIELEPDEVREIVFLIGECESNEEAEKTVKKFTALNTVKESFAAVTAYWDDLLGAIEVRTPEASLDTIVNRWLLCQSLACRVWARSAFYQSGGAFGFRDQLQDVMSLVYTKPEIAREQILLAAAHQFEEGDVQHWWHPPSDRGVRTRFSDDLLWLPFVASFYVNVTGDQLVFDEMVSFVEAPLLVEGQDDSYTKPTTSVQTATLFEHCARAVDHSLATGINGLPLMGSGDWNDGMSSVGNKGLGESVWVGWFLINTLKEFTPFCKVRGEEDRNAIYLKHAEDLKSALEKNAWDGNWFRRAYFDDGTPLGSAENEECKIDSIAQSWSVISGGANPQQAARAMASVDEYLIRRGDGLILLFTPPFDKSPVNPGYIKGYLPGVRENGGQYTHAAIWTVIAFAMLGDGDKAGELFALLNPINHASTRAGLHKYKVEPYVVAGDVYNELNHIGRGGWTWYTGAASWMYRAALESILGFHLQGDVLTIEPCIPRSWRSFEINYRREKTLFKIKVENPSGICSGVAVVRLDGTILPSGDIPLIQDGQTHEISVVMGDSENPERD